jgi:hypothetical protein
LLILFAIALGIYSQSGKTPARHQDLHSSPDGRDGSALAFSPVLPLDDLKGHWTGTSYRGEYGTFTPTTPLQKSESGRPVPPDPARTASLSRVDVTIEITEKYLSMKGVESCWVSLTYHPVGGDSVTTREMYRIHPPAKPIRREARSSERSDAELRRGFRGLPRWEIEERHDLISFRRGVDEFQIVSLQEDVMEL